MKNFGYLISIFSNIKFYSIFDEGEDSLFNSLRRNILRSIIALFGLLLSGYALMKIYEVPVYYTKIDDVFDDCIPDEFGQLNIRICRDYDRSDKSSVIPDSSLYDGNSDNGHYSGIYICGKINQKMGSSSDNMRIVNKLRQNIDSVMYVHTRKKTEKSSMAYFSIETSSRQHFIPFRRHMNERINTIVNEQIELTGIDKAFNISDIINIDKKYEISNLFIYTQTNREWGANGYLDNFYFIASEHDKQFPVNFRIQGSSFLNPSIWNTAEDISKLVEVIELGHSKREKTRYAGAWCRTNSLTIDYVGPTEFSDNLKPEPDEKTLTYIRYTDKKKIERIGRYGLRYHVKFPDMENIQEARIFILSGIITGFGALLAKNIWRISCDIYRIRKKRSSSEMSKILVLSVILIVFTLLCFGYLITVDSNVDPFLLHGGMKEM